MPRPRIFRSTVSNQWVSPLLVVSRGLVSVGNCVPFPYVNVVLSSGLALLELIQMVGRSSDDLEYLAESVVALMKLLREEIDFHLTPPDLKFRDLCLEFDLQLTQISKDLASMSKNWSSSKFRKYLNSHNISDEIARLTRQVNDLRANTMLSAAIGTRMDLAGVTNRVAAVESGMSDLHRELVDQRSAVVLTRTDYLKQEFARFEEDFHALKLGDIYLEFPPVRTISFLGTNRDGPGHSLTGWTDYKATVHGSAKTVRVYQGSDPTEIWTVFLSFLANRIRTPHLPQLFGFCSSPRLRSLVFHGEFLTLDEYAQTLPSAQDVVDWELSLMSEIREFQGPDNEGFKRLLKFALVNTRDGRIVISHVGQLADREYASGGKPRAFLNWFVRRGFYIPCTNRWVTAADGHIRDVLRSLAPLQRDGHHPAFLVRWRSIHEALTSRGCVYHKSGRRIAQLADREFSPDPSWHVATDMKGLQSELRLQECVPTVADELKNGFTHFVVPLLGKSRSSGDNPGHCGYFLNADIFFGVSIPDISHSWLTQASAILSKSTNARCKPSDFVLPIYPRLELTWEMVPATENTAARAVESWSPLANLPAVLHVFVQVPIVNRGRIEEPRIYWSTDANLTETGLIPPSMLEMRIQWDVDVPFAWWESHHYEVAKTVQEQHGFDPSTNAAVQSLGLPLLDVPSDTQDYEGSSARSPKDNWCRYFVKDPHTMQEVDRW